ncbi:monovalent cation/H(+) antiporter subunit G [Pararhizobium haloflavum]|uniref:monovalent cation/H(+) antiporter subunit G n=1 Tax=Pararhizobium haloflavum TaxID=2037914 RepID=UPI000C178A4C|nr:monovalent cation/H(+) antiporter subunit G [Pararhizobium haloflavum]
MEAVVAIFTAVIVVVGSVFSLLAAVGVVRLPDIYTRMHAASKAGTVGSGLLLIALGVHSLDGGTFSRSIAGVIFLLLTAPISAHLLAKAAYASGYKLSDKTILNEMPNDEDKL